MNLIDLIVAALKSKEGAPGMPGAVPGAVPSGAPVQAPMTSGIDPAMLQAGAVPTPQGDTPLHPLVAALQQRSGLLNLLRNKRNETMNEIDQATQ